jgi:hypothetical protein
MEWTTDYREKDKIVCVKTSGLMDWGHHKKFCEELFPFARRHGSHRFLVDHQDIKVTFSLLQLDDLPKLLKEVGLEPEDKIAVLYNPSWNNNSNFSFFKNLTIIGSLQLQFFTDNDVAIAWLKSEK